MFAKSWNFDDNITGLINYSFKNHFHCQLLVVILIYILLKGLTSKRDINTDKNYKHTYFKNYAYWRTGNKNAVKEIGKKETKQ